MRKGVPPKDIGKNGVGKKWYNQLFSERENFT